MHRVHFIRVTAKSIGHKLSLLLLVLLVSACESALNLEGVKESAEQSIKRTDTFQAFAQSKDRVVVVGNYGVIVVSADDGKSWSRTELQGAPTLIDIAACPDGDFFTVAYESELWHSTDGGLSWKTVQLGTREIPQALTCDVLNRLWLIGGFATIQSSTNKGNSWNDQSLNDDLFLTNIQFVNGETGYISGEFGTVLKTEDAGKSWQHLATLPDNFYPHTALFKEGGIGWVGGLGGQILNTRDGGKTWDPQQTPSIAPIYSIAAINDRLFAVGGAGVFFVFEDNQWKKFEHGELIRFFLRAIGFTPNNKILIAGGGGTLLQVNLNKSNN